MKKQLLLSALLVATSLSAQTGHGLEVATRSGNYLFEQAHAGNWQLVFALLQEGNLSANMHHTPIDKTLLDLAVKQQDTSAIRTLLALGASPSMRGGQGGTVLHRLFASIEPMEIDADTGRLRQETSSEFLRRLEIAKMLISAEKIILEMSSRDHIGGLALHVAWHRCLRAQGAQLGTIFIEWVQRSGLDVDNQDPKGNTYLHLAACQDNAPLILVLLEAGASPSKRNQDNETPIQVALKNNNRHALQAFAQRLCESTEV